MHTEEEMKAKVCWKTMGCAVRENCIGSACVAWRVEHNAKFEVVDGRYAAIPGYYCGAAGKP